MKLTFEEIERKIIAEFHGYTSIRKKHGKLIGRLLNNSPNELPHYHCDLNAIREVELYLSRAAKHYYIHIIYDIEITKLFKLHNCGYDPEFEINKEEILLLTSAETKVAALLRTLATINYA